MTACTTPKVEERSARDRLNATERARAANAKASARRRGDVIRDELARPRAKACRCQITPATTLAEFRALGAECTAGRWVYPTLDAVRRRPGAWLPPTLTNAGGPSTQSPSGRHHRRDVCDAYRALWAMTRDERIAAMWRGELSLRQLCRWSSRAQHEIPLLGGEFAWIVMRTPEWAEASNQLAAGHVPAEPPGGRLMTITLTTIGSRGVTLMVGRSALEEAPDGVAPKLTPHDGPLVLTLTHDEAQALNAELTEELGATREAP